MFLYNPFFWIGAVVILTLTGLALAGAAYLRQKRLRKKFHVEISNQGNVDSRYQLRLRDPDSLLDYSFFQDGNQLPELVTSSRPGQHEPDVEEHRLAGSTPQSSQPAENAVEKAATLSGSISDFLMTIAGFLPGRLRSPLMRASSQIYQGGVQGRRAQELSDKVRSRGDNTRQPSSQTTMQNRFSSLTERWAETPAIKPGEALVVDLIVKPARSEGRMEWPFQLVSRSMEVENSPEVIEEGLVHLPGGFWIHRVYPNLVIIASAIVLLIAVAYWTSA